MDRPYDAEVRRLVAASTRFGFSLLAEVGQIDAGQNVCLSPISVHLALAMTLNGAIGETRQAITHALALQGVSLEKINRASAALRASLGESGPGVGLHVANALWAAKDITLKPEFLQANREFYGAEIANLDFETPGAAAAINKWVSEQTGGKIGPVLGEIDPLAALVLVNATPFDGQWRTPFDAALTEEGAFQLPDGGQKTCRMMRAGPGPFGYLRGDTFEAVRLPYLSPGEAARGAQPRASMLVFLPDRHSSLNEFRDNLTAENWQSWASAFKDESLAVVLPRFTSACEVSLNAALSSMGMQVAFDSARADLGGMCAVAPARLVYIDRLLHKTFVAVTEKGTQAGAATSVGVQTVSATAPSPQVVVDRPFFYAIRDDETGVVLFAGFVVAPA